MGYLRGAVMKIGQTLANFPDIVPDQFVETLAKLHFEAPPMHFSLLREQVCNELGDEPEVLFAEFDYSSVQQSDLDRVSCEKVVAHRADDERLAFLCCRQYVLRSVDWQRHAFSPGYFGNF